MVVPLVARFIRKKTAPEGEKESGRLRCSDTLFRKEMNSGQEGKKKGQPFFRYLRLRKKAIV